MEDGSHVIISCGGKLKDHKIVVWDLETADKRATFKSDGGSALAGARASVPEPAHRPGLYRYQKTSPTLREEVAHYDRAHPNARTDLRAPQYSFSP